MQVKKGAMSKPQTTDKKKGANKPCAESNTTKKAGKSKKMEKKTEDSNSKLLPLLADETVVDLTNDDDETEMSLPTSTDNKTEESAPTTPKEESSQHCNKMLYNSNRNHFYFLHPQQQINSCTDKARESGAVGLSSGDLPEALDIGGGMPQLNMPKVVATTTAEDSSFPKGIPAFSQRTHSYFMNRNNNGHEHAPYHKTKPNFQRYAFVSNLLEEWYMEYQKIRSRSCPSRLNHQRRSGRINHRSSGDSQLSTFESHPCCDHRCSRMPPPTTSAITQSVTSTFTAPSVSSVPTMPRPKIR